MFKRNILLVVLLALMLFGVGAVGAQEPTELPVATEEAPVVIIEPGEEPVTVVDEVVVVVRDQNPVLLTVLAIAGVVVIVLLGAVFLLIGKLYDAMPPALQQLLISNRTWLEARVDDAWDYGDRLADLTPSEIDDMIMEFGREQTESFLRRFFDDRDVAALMAKSPPA